MNKTLSGAGQTMLWLGIRWIETPSSLGSSLSRTPFLDHERIPKVCVGIVLHYLER